MYSLLFALRIPIDLSFLLLCLKVGFFGYVAFYESGIRGDILANFSSGLLADTVKAGRLRGSQRY